MEAGKKSATFLFALLWLGLVGFLLFYRLDFLPLRIWDESRQAVQVYEMRENGDWVVPHFESAPDMWNTKPPLLVWAQLVSVKIFGYGEWGIRFPVALCGLFTCVVLLLYLKRAGGSWWPGFVAGLVLVTINPYTGVHGARTGDFDVPLTLFLTWAACSFFAYLQLGNKPKDLYIFFVALAAAVLVKSVAGLFLLPAFGLFFLFGKYSGRLIFNRHFLAGSGIFLSMVLGYYLLREYNNPGYLQAVWDNEIGGRYGQALENHEESRWFYFNRIWHQIHGIWIGLFFAGVLYVLFARDKTFRKVGLFALLIFVQYLLLVTWAKTKLFWYDIPLYPFAAVVVSIPVYRAMQFLADRQKWLLKPAVVFLLLFAVPYFLTARRMARPAEPNNWDEDFYALSACLKQSLHDPSQRGNLKIVYEGYHAHLTAYRYMYRDKGRVVEFVSVEEMKPGDTVWVNQPAVKEKLRALGNIRVQTLNRTAEAITLIR